MAQLIGQIISNDDAFKKHIGRMLRSGAIPVSLLDERLARDGTSPDVIIVDIRGDASSAMAGIERQRAAAPGAGIFAVALAAEPDLIVESMRAGANEFFTWPPPDETFYGAIRRTAARRETRAGRASLRHDARVLRRQRRRRHDDHGGELRRGAVAPQQEIDGDRRSRSRAWEKLPSSSASVSATACSTPSTTCTGSIASSCASSSSSTSRGSRFSRDPISSIVPARRTAAPSRSCSGSWRASTNTSSSTPAVR